MKHVAAGSLQFLLALVLVSADGVRSARAQDVNALFQPRVSDASKCPRTLGGEEGKEATKACLDQLAVDLGVKPPPGQGSRRSPLAAVQANALAQQAATSTHTELLRRYAAYLAAKRNLSLLSPADRREAAVDQGAVSDEIHKLLQDHGLEETEPLTGELRAGSALTDAGNVSGAPRDASNSSAQALAHITWTTAHAGALDKLSGGDVAVAGSVGLQPAMTIVKSASGALDAKYQQALVIDAVLDLSRFTGRTETSLLVKGGFVRLGELAQIVERDGASELAIPAGPAGKVAPYLESTVRFALFDRPMALVHLTHTELSPRLSLEGGYRRDARFKDLETIGDAQNLLVARLMVDGLQIVDKRTAPISNKTFTASFGFEYTKGKSSLPYGFSFIIRGDLDLLKALGGGGHIDQP